MPQASVRQRPMLPRGVWRPPLTVGGLPVIMAVDDAGDVLDWRRVGPEDDIEAIRAHMWALVDGSAEAAA